MGFSVKDICISMERWAPKETAESWDNVGLLVGDPGQEVKGILTALDVTKENVMYAIENHINLIVAHHPILFKPLKSLAQGTLQTDMIALLQKHSIAVYAAHTNLDIAVGGVNDVLASLLALQDISGLVKTGEEKMYKVVVMVPNSYAEEVRQALGKAGAGYIGNYSHCSFSVNGTGRFLPESGAKPFLGNIGVMELASEERIETIVPQGILAQALTAMINVHPYEEVAYDVYPLENVGKSYWLGRIGRLEKEISAQVALERIRSQLGIPILRYAGNIDRTVQTIAICSGAGMDFWRMALQRGADLYLTSDIKYHEAQEAAAAGLLVVDGHHFYTEQRIADTMARYLQSDLPEIVSVTADPTRKDIFGFVGEN